MNISYILNNNHIGTNKLETMSEDLSCIMINLNKAHAYFLLVKRYKIKKKGDIHL